MAIKTNRRDECVFINLIFVGKMLRFKVVCTRNARAHIYKYIYLNYYIIYNKSCGFLTFAVVRTRVTCGGNVGNLIFNFRMYSSRRTYFSETRINRDSGFRRESDI